MSVLDRLATKFEIHGECWVWTAAKSTNGYGLLDDDEKRTRRAHRLVYEQTVGPIPEGLELDHLCRNRLCINPDHLEPVTHAENMARTRGLRVRQSCPSGHPYDETNTVVISTPRGPERRCRICKVEQLRAWRRRHRG